MKEKLLQTKLKKLDNNFNKLKFVKKECCRCVMLMFMLDDGVHLGVVINKIGVELSY